MKNNTICSQCGKKLCEPNQSFCWICFLKNRVKLEQQKQKGGKKNER